ncbi:NAD-dependent deacylase [Vitreoscilla massiliensis]|uniref:NAD-dependent protein deacylase n=1 Tax=Vitreoscilla massiliensis TaxID=1689272 RepID=A0ABY4DXH2_9NEIS|nr:Sir2 family NAD-dependent protein deacetylase [Vitreoscilla massiliensis]UOO88224.1 NAD-dependent deacylase [Vitreoscilla massiliensis]
MATRPKVVVLTGAGISAESGLLTFRDAGGLWEGHRVEEVATPEAFARNPQLVLNFYNQRRAQLQQVHPNAAHLALVALEQAYDVHIITQNVDDLHERAGSTQVLHLHGELTKVRSSVNEDYVIAWQGDQQLDDTDPQGYAMRPFIVWFGEAVPMIEVAIRVIATADVVLVVGTSMQVYPAAGLLDYAPLDIPIYYIDPAAKPMAEHVQIRAEVASSGVPAVVQELLAAAS